MPLTLSKISSIFKTHPLHPIQMALFILIELLLVFGKEFSKFHLFWQFHLYDFLFFILALWSAVILIRREQKFFVWPIIIILLISLMYVIYSYLSGLGQVSYIVRHYALFIYLGCSYVIFASFIDQDKNHLNIRFIVLIAIAAIPLQIITHVYNFSTIENYPLFTRHNYLSYMVVMGLIVFGAYSILFLKKRSWQILIFILILFLSMTFNHASAFLACFIIPGFYIMLTMSKRFKIYGLAFLLIAIIGFGLYFPEFSDQNSDWRLLYWKETIKESIFDYYGVIGHGFGVPYVTEETILKFKELLNSAWFVYNPEEQFLSPMHNSFITIIFHIGLVPALLILLPLRKTMKYFFQSDGKERSKRIDFLILAFIGISVWTSFNVILELPHSSAFFWLIYFSLIYEVDHYHRQTTKA